MAVILLIPTPTHIPSMNPIVKYCIIHSRIAFCLVWCLMSTELTVFLG